MAEGSPSRCKAKGTSAGTASCRRTASTPHRDRVDSTSPTWWARWRTRGALSVAATATRSATAWTAPGEGGVNNKMLTGSQKLTGIT
eukprot:5327148-Pyramimonas_sp.AAC.1